MRALQKLQLGLGQIAIEDIDLDPKSKDDIPAILFGIQFIFRNKDLLNKILEAMQKHLFSSDSKKEAKGDASSEDN